MTMNYDHLLNKLVRVTLKDGHDIGGIFVGEDKDHYLIDHKVVTGRYTKNYVRSIELVERMEDRPKKTAAFIDEVKCPICNATHLLDRFSWEDQHQTVIGQGEQVFSCSCGTDFYYKVKVEETMRVLK